MSTGPSHLVAPYVHQGVICPPASTGFCWTTDRCHPRLFSWYIMSPAGTAPRTGTAPTRFTSSPILDTWVPRVVRRPRSLRLTGRSVTVALRADWMQIRR